MRLFNFLMFCMILCGANLLISVIAILMTYGPQMEKITFGQWAAQDHPFLFMFILGIDMVSFAIFLINTVKKEKE